MGEDIRRGVPPAKYFPGDEWWKPTGWEETAILLAGMKSDSTRVVEWLTPVQPTLAYRCALESGAPCSEPALNVLREPSADPAVRRAPIACAEGGRRMAQRGDHRPGVGLRPDGLPDLVWCPVASGKFIFGEGRELDIPYEYAIAKYPVTYAQYAAFVESDDGYTNDAYWTKAGQDWRKDRREPSLWNDPQWHIANHPVVGVTWCEAYAFCKWLSAKTGQEIHLPTEAEWEKAARGKDGLIYPYGNTVDPSKGNTSESQIGRTSAVGMFPGGASPYDALDMSGNVWEWCLTKWADTYQHPGDNTPEGIESRCLRGGSWSHSQDYSHAGFRYMHKPHFRSSSWGFRVMVSSPI